jgi:hypothetical protein
MTKANVLQLTDFREAEMLQFALDQIALARAANPFGGDPFADRSMHALVRRTLKNLAEHHERNMARIVDLALAGAEDAIEALKDLIAERNAAGLPLAGALGTFDTILNDRPPQHRRPEGRPPESFLENFVIVCLLITLMRQFPRLKLRRSPSSKRPSVYSVLSAALIEAGVGRGGEEAIRKDLGLLRAAGDARLRLELEKVDTGRVVSHAFRFDVCLLRDRRFLAGPRIKSAAPGKRGGACHF